MKTRATNHSPLGSGMSSVVIFCWFWVMVGPLGAPLWPGVAAGVQFRPSLNVQIDKNNNRPSTDHRLTPLKMASSVLSFLSVNTRPWVYILACQRRHSLGHALIDMKRLPASWLSRVPANSRGKGEGILARREAVWSWRWAQSSPSHWSIHVTWYSTERNHILTTPKHKYSLFIPIYTLPWLPRGIL